MLGLSPNAETQNTFLNSSSSNSFLGPNDLLGRRGAAILPLKPFLNERPLRLTGGASGGVCPKLPIKGMLRPAAFIPCRIATPNMLPGQLADNFKLLFVACLAFCSPPKLHDSIGRRIDDALDLRGECFKRTLHFAAIFVLIVNASHATDDVAKAALGNVGADTGPAHQCSARAPKIVQPPAGYASCRRQPCQWRGQRKRMATIIAENKCPAVYAWQTFQNILRCFAQWPDKINRDFVSTRRERPVVFRYLWPCDLAPFGAACAGQQQEAH